jgi:hypothetical protein
MRELINIYCDESCHLENDGETAMVLGAVFCPVNKKKEIFERLFELKKKHNLIPKHKKNDKSNRTYYELKWNKVSIAKINYFKDVIDYFFAVEYINFRVLVVPNKSSLDYQKYNHTHDTFYYKMYFSMLKAILNPEKSHHIFIDIKDTRSKEKVHKLEQVLRNDKYDYSKEIIKMVQQVRSHEVELIQLADLFTGALSYVHRGLKNSKAKNILIDHIRHRSRYSLLKSTLIREQKFNIFIWEPSKYSHIL